MTAEHYMILKHGAEKKSGRRVGVNAPPHTRAKIGQGYPLRAPERHADTTTDGNKPEIEPTSDILTRADQRADSDKKTRHEATHAATVPPRADERQERRRKDTARPPHQPKTAKSGRRHQDAERRQADDTRTPEDGTRTPSDGRRTPRGRRSDTTRTRSHITNGGGYARTRAQRV